MGVGRGGGALFPSRPPMRSFVHPQIRTRWAVGDNSCAASPLDRDRSPAAGCGLPPGFLSFLPICRVISKIPKEKKNPLETRSSTTGARHTGSVVAMHKVEVYGVRKPPSSRSLPARSPGPPVAVNSSVAAAHTRQVRAPAEQSGPLSHGTCDGRLSPCCAANGPRRGPRALSRSPACLVGPIVIVASISSSAAQWGTLRLHDRMPPSEVMDELSYDPITRTSPSLGFSSTPPCWDQGSAHCVCVGASAPAQVPRRQSWPGSDSLVCFPSRLNPAAAAAAAAASTQSYM
jgi:hypothetical protein